MILFSALLHLLTGLAYVFGIGVLSAVDLLKIYRTTRQISFFGLAFFGMGVTCGPHHLEHAIHLLDRSVPYGPASFTAALITLGPGAVFLALRVEGVLGGRGDRVFASGDRVLFHAPQLLALYGGAVIAVPLARHLSAGLVGAFGYAMPQVALVVLYSAIGWVLWSTQFVVRRNTGMWSVSGIALALIFPTCAVSHAVYAIDLGRGRLPADTHLAVIDTAGVVAAAGFLVAAAITRLKTGREHA